MGLQREGMAMAITPEEARRIALIITVGNLEGIPPPDQFKQIMSEMPHVTKEDLVQVTEMMTANAAAMDELARRRSGRDMDAGDAAEFLGELAKGGDQEAIDVLAAIGWPPSGWGWPPPG
jgi:hypothetical protein